MLGGWHAWLQCALLCGHEFSVVCWPPAHVSSHSHTLFSLPLSPSFISYQLPCIPVAVYPCSGLGRPLAASYDQKEDHQLWINQRDVQEIM
jgi:hypothetical protein